MIGNRTLSLRARERILTQVRECGSLSLRERDRVRVTSVGHAFDA
jgi:hypothetical protein